MIRISNIAIAPNGKVSMWWSHGTDETWSNLRARDLDDAAEKVAAMCKVDAATVRELLDRVIDQLTRATP